MKSLDPVIRGENSVELRTSKDGTDYLKLDWQCVWSVTSNMTEGLGKSQMRTMLFFKHKFANTYTVLVTWLTLDLCSMGVNHVTRVARRKYRVNLNSRKVVKPAGYKAIRLDPQERLWEGYRVPCTVGMGGEETPWSREKLEKELLIMTNYADMMWRSMDKRGVNRVEL